MSISVDLSGIDLAALIERETGKVRFGKALGNGEKRTQKSSCPWCDGTDRFAVVDSDPQHFYCGIHGGSGCNKSGDAVKFMQLWHHISFTEACNRLNVVPLKDGEVFKPAQGARVYVNRDTIPCDVWRSSSEYFLHVCQALLWHEKTGVDARAYLAQRGFTHDEMRERGYGFNPKTIFDRDVARWGITDDSVKAVWLPRGLVIPYFVGSDLWKINIRRPRVDIQAEEKRTGRTANKYVNIKGGSNPIYRADTIKPGLPLVIFEGEYNADILAMVLKNAGISDISVIATGSTGKGRADNWLAKIAKASPILVSFDPDGAGSKAVKDYWLKVLPNALAWPSRNGDLNDMFLAGADIVKWLNKGLKIAGVTLADSSLPVAPEQGKEIPENCEDCNAPIELSDGRNFFYWQISALQAHCFCDLCRDPETGEPRQKELQPAEDITVSSARQLLPEDVAAKFAKAFTDWDVTILPGPPVYELPAKEETPGPDFWQWVERRVMEPPRFHVPDLDENGVQKRSKPTPIYDEDGTLIGMQPGNKLFKLGGPMMSREAWAKQRAEQLAWRPDPALLAHRTEK